MASALKKELEDLLRLRRLQREGPPLRGEDRRRAPLPIGIPALDDLLPDGGLPRGQLSELYGAPSSGRTGVALSLASQCTAGGTLVAWVDPLDRLDPASAASAGVDLARLLWLRGDPSVRPRALLRAVAAAGTLVDSGVFDLVALDVAGFTASELQRLPGATWLRLQRALEDTAAAGLLLSGSHLAHGPRGASLCLQAQGAEWSGRPGPGRLLAGLAAEARRTGGTRRAPLHLRALA
jgi:hypothetical protein